MIYKNDSPDAGLAMERHRTGNYGEDDYYNGPCCDICGDDRKLYSMDGNTLCTECLKEYLLHEFKDAYSVIQVG